MNRKLFFIIFLIFFTVIISNYIFYYRMYNNTLYAKTDKDEKKEKEKKDAEVTPTPKISTPSQQSTVSPTSSTQTSFDKDTDTNVDNSIDNKSSENSTGLLNSNSPLNIFITDSNRSEEDTTQNSNIPNNNNKTTTKNIDSTDDSNNDASIESNQSKDFNANESLLNDSFNINLSKKNTIEEAIKTSKKSKERRKHLIKSKNSFGFFVIKSFKKKSKSSDKIFDFKTFNRVLYFNEKNTSTTPKSNKVENNTVTDKKNIKVEPISIYKEQPSSKNFWVTLPLTKSVSNYTKWFGILIFLLSLFKIIFFVKK